jgi:hypothetical protein
MKMDHQASFIREFFNLTNPIMRPFPEKEKFDPIKPSLFGEV